MPDGSGARFMYLRFIPLLVLLFSSRLYAYEFPLDITEYIDDVKVVAYINNSDIKPELNWEPFASAPLLSIASALQAIQAYSANTELADMMLTGIELKQIPHHENQWHYLVKVKTEVDEVFESHYFIVLMNGKVIPALKEPDSIK
jgi:hypothetical protein